ncbi:hypothetical protein [Chelativorans sp.]|uniref:hypothetical protein n=1 Tax=Chelativorans sp. TaxID=2203393 RepID=UPI002811F2A9|nr:hypothetical protein [Chelativorans sp.]
MSGVEEPIMVRYRDSKETPPVERGDLETFILAVRKKDGRIAAFPADYLNDFPLWVGEPELPARRGRFRVLAKAEGTNATGWFDHLPDDANDAIISPMTLAPGDELLGWVPVAELTPTAKIR